MPERDDQAQLSLFGTTNEPAGKASARPHLGGPETEGIPKKAAEIGEKRVAVAPIFAAFKVKEDPFPDVSDLDTLRQRIEGCARCKLCEQRTNIVFGEGDPHASIMCIGEGPGATEDQTGRPFVGAAGQLLDRILASVGFERKDVFIANIVKCRPPGNRLPEPAEALTCLPFLLDQIRIISPRIILCLGALATQTLVDPRARITAMRGIWHEKAGIKWMPTFHPAALLRDVSKKKPVWEDMKLVRSAYDETR